MRGSRNTFTPLRDWNTSTCAGFARRLRDPVLHAVQPRCRLLPEDTVETQRHGRNIPVKLLNPIEIPEIIGHYVFVEVDAKPAGLAFQELCDVRLRLDQTGVRPGNSRGRIMGGG